MAVCKIHKYGNDSASLHRLTVTNICVVYSRKIVYYLYQSCTKKNLRFFLVLHVCDKATITQQCRIVHYTFRWTIFVQLQSFKAGRIWKFDIRPKLDNSVCKETLQTLFWLNWGFEHCIFISKMTISTLFLKKNIETLFYFGTH